MKQEVPATFQKKKLSEKQIGKMKKMIGNHILLALFSLGLFNSCKKSGVDNRTEILKPISLPAGAAGVINSINNFAFDFFKNTLQNDETASNKLISPLSIYIALSMVYNGSDNATRDSIAHALRLNSSDVRQLNSVCKILIEELPIADSRVKLSIANSIWFNTTSPQPLPGFLSITNESFHASANGLNFSASDHSLNTINNWVANNTNQKILKILNTISPDDLMYLVNAVYFKGTWKHRFNLSRTAHEDFHLPGGGAATTAFMIQENTVNYARYEDLQMLELPYSGGAYNMYILLPDDNINLNKRATALNNAVFQQILSDTQPVKMEIHLPKWKSSYRMDSFRPELAPMGMDIAFTKNADFSKMYSTPVQITKSVHQTFVEVNEEGTEAAAATVIGIGLTSVTPPPVIKLNRPFTYVIGEKTSGVILFTGVVNNPLEN